MKRAVVHLAWIGALLWGGAAAAQQGEAPTPVDPSVSDVGPLSESLREIARGLQQPTGFSRDYWVPGRPD